MSAVLSLNSLGQISRTVPDIAAATAWYRDILGLRLLYDFEGMAFFDLGDLRLYLQQSSSAGTESVLYFRVPDIAAAHEALAERGVAFTGLPHRVHRHQDGSEEWLAFFCDPEGRPLALIARTPPEIGTNT